MSLIETARNWAAHDPDPETKAEILTLVDAGDEAELAQRFQGPLAFGTAGLRAKVGAGESRLNQAVITRVTYGLTAWLRSKIGADPVIVVGCDARHGSKKFQQVAAEVISALGGRALVLPPENPTPLTAFSVKKYHADAGIMVTASHNPPADNGYKVYLGGRVATGAAEGVQLVSPADKEIASAFEAAPMADEIALSTDNIEQVDPREEYIARAKTLAGEHRDVTIALTPMHGVGGAIGHQLLSELGFTVSVVPEQADPDPDFPTVSFPNPEEQGALDLAKRHAESIDADVIIAYDPDADRCAVATRVAGQWRQLSGDETGALLGQYIAARGATGAFANSIVSSRLLGQIAKAHGLHHENTLTGFKWIARTPELAFGYEEAIGYCCDPAAVADKDGISASVLVASLVGELKAQGRTLMDALDDLARTHGLYLSAPLTFRVSDLSLIAEGMHTLRTNPPTQLAGAKVTEVIDLAAGTLPCGATDGMYFVTERDDRVIVRPSGTEPKLKCYLEVVFPVTGEDVPREAAQQRLTEISEELRAHLGM
ncbi:phospho-sugar mutase [Corynebacterium hindlerae]|uniref:Phospho-sugar mutase n=1 Tax=Corynebacterium hindlerae TaxID=699041 RepID=A0A7G5FHQ5_9CORY|nr:phospho-sugar mutase [Corynebacterium hindlerae]QMV86146.1 phospho-sugar mutase [Corynebacterium hindlerae]